MKNCCIKRLHVSEVNGEIVKSILLPQITHKHGKGNTNSLAFLKYKYGTILSI